ncbi:hypothetical protein CLOSTASPAR_04614 [[Clostridium] asparagiforme DSM 15981]|uniref:Uncharacterized protein n=1 Tax=[Clostridium] asparagiforme DSM 15981 TaxID=518636 RepID=C0D5R8_9FIRM|nr:hypothetical protein CLOSTASPAR_04614 [[Clostridium] asparagiforme DSM 15981]
MRSESLFREAFASPYFIISAAPVQPVSRIKFSINFEFYPNRFYSP